MYWYPPVPDHRVGDRVVRQARLLRRRRAPNVRRGEVGPSRSVELPGLFHGRRPVPAERRTDEQHRVQQRVVHHGSPDQRGRRGFRIGLVPGSVCQGPGLVAQLPGLHPGDVRRPAEQHVDAVRRVVGERRKDQRQRDRIGQFREVGPLDRHRRPCPGRTIGPSRPLPGPTARALARRPTAGGGWDSSPRGHHLRPTSRGGGRPRRGRGTADRTGRLDRKAPRTPCASNGPRRRNAALGIMVVL